MTYGFLLIISMVNTHCTYGCPITVWEARSKFVTMSGCLKAGNLLVKQHTRTSNPSVSVTFSCVGIQ